MNEFGTIKKESRFRKASLVSIVSVCLLILIGGVVRSTGSGLGCPDWPTCFGLWVPPTEASQIPPTFFEQNEQYNASQFNVYQTWIEYVNRLIGVLIGISILITLWFSRFFLKKSPSIFVLSFIAFTLTAFEGWLGKVVVDQELEGGYVTLHMFFAMLILMVLLLAHHLSRVSSRFSFQSYKEFNVFNFWLGTALTSSILVQILLGTQVREHVDRIIGPKGTGGRSGVIESLGTTFEVHKIMWILIVVGIVYWILRLRKTNGKQGILHTMSILMLLAVMGEVLLGLLLVNFDLPPAIQPLHLVFACLLFAASFTTWLHISNIERKFFPGNKLSVSRELQLNE